MALGVSRRCHKVDSVITELSQRHADQDHYICILVLSSFVTLMPMLVTVQVREGAAAAGVLLGGENALPCFVPGGVDQYALDRIVYNTKPWSPPLQVT